MADKNEPESSDISDLSVFLTFFEDEEEEVVGAIEGLCAGIVGVSGRCARFVFLRRFLVLKFTENFA